MRTFNFLFIACVIFFSTNSYSQVPQKLSYQGLLTTSGGSPVADGNYNLKFEIYNLPTGGTLRHSETQTGVSVQHGTFSVMLGTVVPLTLAFNESLYVEVTALSGTGIPAPITFSPRSELTSSPYSLAPWATSVNNIYYNSGYVGIGTNTPLRKLHIGTGTTVNNVFSDVLLNHADADDHYYEVTNTSGFGLFGLSSGNTKIVSSNNLVFSPGTRTAMTMTPAGDIGIGTTTPDGKLEVAGTVKAYQFRGPLVVNGGNITYASDGGDHIFTTAVTERMRLTLSGNVGIGTTSPNEQLEITGNLRLPSSTASVGVIKSGADRFIHNFGIGNFFAGINSGNLTLPSYTGENTGVGSYALQALTSGIFNTAVGHDALYNNTSGYYNTAIGRQALYHNTSGYNNTAVGLQALYNDTTGIGNTALGVYALGNNIFGSYNTAVGNNALINNMSGLGNTVIGYGADVSTTGLTNATAIGYMAWVNASNKVCIGNASVTVIEGQVAWSWPSDVRIKKEIKDSDLGLEFINKLRPVSFKMKNATDDNLNYGFIAQEVESVLGEKKTNIVMTDNDSEKMKTMRYTELIAPLVKAVQEQQKEIDELKALVKSLSKALNSR